MSPPLSPVTSPLTHALDPRDVDAIAERMRARLVAARTVRALRRAADLRRRRSTSNASPSSGTRDVDSQKEFARSRRTSVMVARSWSPRDSRSFGRGFVIPSWVLSRRGEGRSSPPPRPKHSPPTRFARGETRRATRETNAGNAATRGARIGFETREHSSRVSSRGASSFDHRRARDATLRFAATRFARFARSPRTEKSFARESPPGNRTDAKRDGEPVHARRSRVARVARSRHRRASGGENATTRARAIRDDGDDGVARGGVEEYSGRTPGGNSRGGARGETRRATRVARVVAEGNGACEGRVEGRVEGEGREAPGRKRRIVGFGTISSSFSSSSEGSVPVRGPDADESIARGGEETSPVDVERFDGGADGCERADGRVTFSTGGSAARRADGAGGRGRASRRRVGTLGDAAGTRGAGHRGETRVDSEERRVRARVGGGGDAVGDGRRSGIGSTNRIPRRRIHHSTRRRGIVPLSGNRRPRAWNLCGR